MSSKNQHSDSRKGRYVTLRPLFMRDFFGPTPAEPALATSWALANFFLKFFLKFFFVEKKVKKITCV